MAIKVKSKTSDLHQPMINDYIDGKVYTPDMMEKAASIIIPSDVKQDTYLNMSIEQLNAALELKQAAIALIKSKFIEGRHYIQPTEAMSPFLTQEGASLIISATNADVNYKKEDETFTEAANLYMCEYRLELKWGSRLAISATGFASSKEADMRKQYEKCTPHGDWVPVAGKSIHDTIHNVQAKAKKRAMVTAVRIAAGITGEFGEEYDNPLANSSSQQGVYTSFYKYAMPYAPAAPKKQKNKNGVKTFTEKERLQWQKDWLRAKILQPGLIKEGLPTFNWGTEDIKTIKSLIPSWVESYLKASEKGKKDETRN